MGVWALFLPRFNPGSNASIFSTGLPSDELVVDPVLYESLTVRGGTSIGCVRTAMGTSSSVGGTVSRSSSASFSACVGEALEKRTPVPGLGTEFVCVSAGGVDGAKDMIAGTDIEVVASAHVGIGIEVAEGSECVGFKAGGGSDVYKHR